MTDSNRNFCKPNNFSSWKYYNPENSYTFEKIDFIWWRDFVLENQNWAYYATGIYILTIYGIKNLMKTRPPFDLRLPLIWWNALLGIFSILGFLRTTPFLKNYICNGAIGFYESICVTDCPEPYIAFWTVAFGISKYVELGDTVFIVLRKRPLKMIQWYHHIATLIVVWIMIPHLEPVGRYFVIMNYGVHSIMYPYFAVKVAGFNVPKMIAICITTTQFLQMIFGLFFNVATLILIAMGKDCYRSRDSIWTFVAVYGSFVVLFGRLLCSKTINRQKAQIQVIA